MSERPVDPGNERLESWKAVAAYLNRDVRTAMRWEKSEGLPIHRLRHLSRSSIYAYPRELDDWRANRRLESSPASSRAVRLRPIAIAATLAICLLSSGTGQFTGPLAAHQDGPVDRVLPWPDEPSKAADESMSPNGHFVAYVDMSTREVAIRNLRTGVARTVTRIARNDGFVDHPLVSNDERRVAFFADDQGHSGVFLLPADANETNVPRRVIEGAVTPRQWSADDRQILVTINHDDESSDIALVAVDAGAIRVLRHVPFPGIGQFIALSPDGRFVAFDQRAEPNHRQRDVWTIRVSDGVANPLVSGSTNDSVFAWSPDGNFVVFRSDRLGSQGTGLWAVPVREGSASGTPILLKAGFRGTPVTLTTAGTLFFEQGDNVDDLVVSPLDVTGGHATPAGTSASHDPGSLSRRPRWSNDGQWLMYETFRAGGSVLSMRNLTTGAVTEVPLELAYWWTFDLSPDGRKMVCRAMDLEQHEGVFMVDTRTGAVEPVVLWKPGVARQFVPQFTVDGRSLTYLVGDYHGHNTLVQRDLTTGAERNLAPIPPDIGNALRRSPDGRYAATYVESASADSTTLRVFDVIEQRVHDVFRVGRARAVTAEDGVQWMPDSRALVANIHGASENARELWWIPVDGGQPRRLDVGVDNVVDSAIAIDPDGRQIAFVAGDPLPSKTAALRYQFRLLEHFLPKR